MAILQLLQKGSWEQEDLDWLMKIKDHLGYGYTTQDLINNYNREDIYICRAQKEGTRGLVIFTTADFPSGRELVVLEVIGKGMMQVQEELHEELKEAGRMLGARWISAAVANKGLQRNHARKLGLEPAFVKMRGEIDGWQSEQPEEQG